MYDLADESNNIWHDLKQGSLGMVLQGLRRDKKVIISLAGVLQVLAEPTAVAEGIGYSVWASANCIGQLSYHQFVGDSSKPAFLEPKDPRWNPLRVLDDGCWPGICTSIAMHDPFLDHSQKVLTHLVARISAEKMKSAIDAADDSEVLDLQRDLLFCLGIALGQALQSHSKSLRSAIGEMVGEMNG